MRIPQTELLAILALVGVIVIASAALAASGTPVPSWFETLATLGFGGALGAYQAPTAGPQPAP